MQSGGAHRAKKLLTSISLALACLASPIPAAANSTSGAWSAVKPWPLIAVHAVLMPDGRVLTYGTKSDGTQKAAFIYDVWDPSAGLDAGHVTLPNTTGTDIFCSSQVNLPGGGQVFIAGGDNWTGTSTTNTANNNSNVFDYTIDTLTRQNNLKRARWYSSSTVLLNGEVYVQGGKSGEDRPEIRSADGTFRILSGANTSDLFYYFPRNFIAPDGRIFGYDVNGNMYYVSTAGTGSRIPLTQFTGPKGKGSSAAMFRPGRILQFGGSAKTAKIIDITNGTPVVTSTASLSSKRFWVNATILANGRVLATGGSETDNTMTGVNYSAEIWNPNTGTWLRGAEGDRARLYHSTALLLPDASVLIAGGGASGPQTNTNVEVYYPPYLYKASGGWAERPAIQLAPSFIDIGGSFAVDLAGSESIDRVVVVKTGSASHSFNMDQRFVELTFQQAGNTLTVQAPTRAADAPPGFYLLFVMNDAGTPSIARIARIGVAGEPDPGTAPVLDVPGDQNSEVGSAVSLQLTATDAESAVLTFGATGLPPGLTIESATGVISGAPTTIGTFDVVVSVSDGVSSDSGSFVWTVSQVASTFTLYPPPSPGPVETGAVVTLEATVEGGTDLLFKWDFDDGTPETGWSPSPSISHEFATPGIHYVTVTAVDAGGLPQVSTVVVTVHLPLTASAPAMSASLALEDRASGSDRLWVVNADNDSVSVFDAASNARLAEIAVGAAPRSLAVLPGEVWVTNKQAATISVIDAGNLAVARTIPLPAGSQPYGIVASPSGGFVYVVLEGTGRLLKIDVSNDTVVDSLDVGANPRHVSVTGNGSLVYVARYITPPLPGESTASVQTPVDVGAEILVVNAAAMAIERTAILRHSSKTDAENQGRGIPNFLGAVAISPDGQSAWVPSKQDNVKRGALRDGTGLTFQNTVRAISSRIDLATDVEDYPRRIDHDNAGVAGAIAFDRFGVHMFVALETSREVAVVDAHAGWEMFRFDTGRAPQGLALSADGHTLYVSNFMDRTVGVYDLAALLDEGISNVPLLATLQAISSERLTAQVLKGKQLFYDAKDARLARDGYLSCASCHNDGGHDGRVWDLTGFGEGLRNTVSLRGRAGAQGFLHWSNNFDEVQDFEGQIRTLAGGTGLMTNTQFNTGTRSQPLGDAKTGVSGDLDALAAYVKSLNAFAPSPHRNANGTLTAAGEAGKAVFEAKTCASCHGGTAFTVSASNNPEDIGTMTAASGKRLGGTLSGIDIPTLRDAWATAPYLHLGSAATLGEAIVAHDGLTLTAGELADLVAYVREIGSQEASAPGEPPPPPPPTSGTGLTGKYYNNKTLSGTPALQRIEAVNFGWGTNSPGPGVNANNFSVRWTGTVKAPATGSYKFRTATNDGVRLWVNGVQVITSWINRSTTATKTSAAINLTAGQQYAITMEFYDNTGAAVARLKWRKPGTTTFPAIPKTDLYPD
jgi:YVTN family beta-propeller protein